jgi:YggT family protein
MISLLVLVLNLYSFVVLARVIITYFPNVDRENPLVRFLFDATEPVLKPIRQVMQRQFPNAGPVDFSPLILLVGIIVLTRVLLVLG